MNAFVQKWGNSLALRIPSSLAKDMRLRQGSLVEIAVKGGAVIIRPAKKKRLSLPQLIKKIAPANLHAEQDWGRPVGREIW